MAVELEISGRMVAHLVVLSSWGSRCGDGVGGRNLGSLTTLVDAANCGH